MSNKVKFISPKYPKLHLILKGGYTTIVGSEKVFTQGLSVDFVRGRFETDNPEIIEKMRKSKFYNTARGFYEDKSESFEEIMNMKRLREEASKHNFFCKVCQKGFDTSNAISAHCRTNAHKMKEMEAKTTVNVREGAIS
jgi:hypothetical protein